VVNPARIKAFAASRLSRQKTDQTDARLIALFCQSQQPEAWTPPAPEQRALQAMVRHLRDIKAIRQQEYNRLTSGVSADVVAHALQQHIAFLDQQILELERQIHDHLERFPLLKQQRDLLDTIPGLGETTIAILLAEVPDIRAFDSASQFAAYAGVTPRHFRSGTSVRARRAERARRSRFRRAALPARAERDRPPRRFEEKASQGGNRASKARSMATCDARREKAKARDSKSARRPRAPPRSRSRSLSLSTSLS